MASEQAEAIKAALIEWRGGGWRPPDEITLEQMRAGIGPLRRHDRASRKASRGRRSTPAACRPSGPFRPAQTRAGRSGCDSQYVHGGGYVIGSAGLTSA